MAVRNKSTPAARVSKPKAIGVIRVSRVGGREGDHFVSPGEQRDKLEAWAKTQKIRLVDVVEEMDVSGGAPLKKRPGLLRAVEAVEAGETSIVVVAYFDRLVRSLRVQFEVVERIEQAGGKVVTLDAGEVSNGTAASWVSSTMLGMMAEYQRRQVAERTQGAKVRAVSDGRAPFAYAPAGYDFDKQHRLVPNDDADTIREAFQLRLQGGSIHDVRQLLDDRKVRPGRPQGRGVWTYNGARSILRNDSYLGRLTFGNLVNDDAHEPIVDIATFQAVQDTFGNRGKRSGRRSQSTRLLAGGVGLLRCGTCGSRLVVGNQRPRGAGTEPYFFYRCSTPRSACKARVAIAAPAVEDYVWDMAREHDEQLEATSVRDVTYDDARRRFEQLDQDLASFIAGVGGLEAGGDAIRKEIERRARLRDEALTVLGQQQAAHHESRITVRFDDPDLELADKRRLLARVIEEVRVNPGRGPTEERVTILFVEPH
jgi:site-specific DNA recombinase